MRRLAVALATLLCFGCATVRPPPPALAGPAPRVALAEPELELWMEGTAPGPIDPAESARSLAAARAALAQALDRRGFAAGGEVDQVLVVRAAAVVRAEERRGRQVGATIGAVLLVVAVVAILVAASRDGGGSGRGAGRAQAAPAPPRTGPSPGGFHPPPYRRPLYPAPWPWWGVGVHVHVPVAPMAALPGPGGEPYSAPALASRLGGRGFWDSDEVELVLELRDARDGRVLWSRATRAELDVRDAGRLREALDRALWDQPWAFAPPPLAEPLPDPRDHGVFSPTPGPVSPGQTP